MNERKRRRVEEVLELAPPPNRFGATFFTEKTLSKLTQFELYHLGSLLEQYYVPRVKPVQEFEAGFRCPVCKTKFDIKARE